MTFRSLASVALFCCAAACAGSTTPGDGSADSRSDAVGDGMIVRDSGSTDTPIATDTRVTDTGGTDSPTTDGPATDVPGSDVPGVDVPGIDVPGSDAPGTDVPTFDSPGSDIIVTRDTGVTDSGVADSGGTLCGASVCAAGQACCAPTSTCYDPRCLSCCMPGPGRCASNADCAPTDYCAGATCGGTGTCTTRPSICTGLFAPVCGCDGTTYSNACTAAAAGVRVASSGACTVVDAGRTDVIVGRDTGDLCTGVVCGVGSLCCPCTGMCYSRACLSCCMFCP